MGNRKIILDIHEIMQQMGIQREAFQISDAKTVNSESDHDSAEDRIHESRESDEDEPRKTPDKNEWQTDLAELIAAAR